MSLAQLECEDFPINLFLTSTQGIDFFIIVNLFICTEGAPKRHMTYDSHSIPSTHPIPTYALKTRKIELIWEEYFSCWGGLEVNIFISLADLSDQHGPSSEDL